MDLLEYEPELPPSTQAVKASTLFQKAQQAAAYQVGDAGLDALFAAEDAANIGLPANHVLEVSAAPGLGKTRCLPFRRCWTPPNREKSSSWASWHYHVLYAEAWLDASADTEGHASPVELRKMALARAEGNDGTRLAK
jgi:hypothetical protein